MFNQGTSKKSYFKKNSLKNIQNRFFVGLIDTLKQLSLQMLGFLI